MPTTNGFLLPSDVEEINKAKKLEAKIAEQMLNAKLQRVQNPLGFLVNPQSQGDFQGLLSTAARLVSPPSGGETLIQSLAGAANQGFQAKTTAELKEMLGNLERSKQALEIAKAKQKAQLEATKAQTERTRVNILGVKAPSEIGANQARIQSALTGAAKEARLSGTNELLNVTAVDPVSGERIETAAVVDSQGRIVSINDPRVPGRSIGNDIGLIVDVRGKNTEKPVDRISKGLQEADIGLVSGALEESQEQNGILQNIAQFRQLNDRIATGLGQRAIGHSKRIAQFAGGVFGFDPGFANAIGDLDTIESLTMRFVLQNIQQTKGAISEREMDAFRKASPNIEKSNLGNSLVLNLAEAKARTIQEQASAQRAWLEKYGSLKGFDKAWSNYINLFTRTNMADPTFGVATSNYGNFERTYLDAGTNGEAQPAWTGQSKDGKTITFTPEDLRHTSEVRGVPVGQVIQALNLRRL